MVKSEIVLTQCRRVLGQVVLATRSGNEFEAIVSDRKAEIPIKCIPIVELFENFFTKHERANLLIHVMDRMGLQNKEPSNDKQNGSNSSEFANSYSKDLNRFMRATRQNRQTVSQARAALFAAGKIATSETRSTKRTDAIETTFKRSSSVNCARLIMACQWLIENYGDDKSKAELKKIPVNSSTANGRDEASMPAARSLSMSIMIKVQSNISQQ